MSKWGQAGSAQNLIKKYGICDNFMEEIILLLNLIINWFTSTRSSTSTNISIINWSTSITSTRLGRGSETSFLEWVI